MSVSSAITYAMIFTTTICTLVGQLILKGAVNAPAMRQAMMNGPLSFLFGAALSPGVWLALAFQVVGYAVWFFVLTREKLAVSFAISGAMIYMLTGVAAWYFYGERLSVQQWVGMILLSAGVMLVAYKPIS